MAAENINNEVIFTYARMNPPHLGHLKMVKYMIEKAKQLNISNIHIYLSLTNDPVKNPLFCDEKMDILKYLIYKHILQKDQTVYLNTNNNINFENKIKISIYCERTPYAVIYKLFEKYDKIHMVVGADRLNTMNKMIQSILTKLNKNSNNYTIQALNRNETSLSATEIRKSITNNNKNKFNRLYKNNNNNNKNNKNNRLNKLYNNLSKRLIKNSKKRKRNITTAKKTTKKNTKKRII